MKDEIKIIKLMQTEAKEVDLIHSKIGQDLASLKAELLKAVNNENVYLDKNTFVAENKIIATSLNKKSFSELVDIANEKIPHEVGFRDILSDDDLIAVNNKVNVYIETFNKKHQLDNWDYAISGGTGFFVVF
jgi:hypothetical protein